MRRSLLVVKEATAAAAAVDTLRLAQGSSAAQESDTSIKCGEEEE